MNFSYSDTLILYSLVVLGMGLSHQLYKRRIFDKLRLSLFSWLYKTEDDEEWLKYTVVYPEKSPVPSKMKTLAFNYDKDILCRIQYENVEALPQGTYPLLAIYNVTGVAEITKEAALKE